MAFSNHIDAAQFASNQLGPHSAAIFATKQSQAVFYKRLGRFADFEDALLGTVYEASLDDINISNEFFSYFIEDLLRIGSGSEAAVCHTLNDTHDLVQSVLSNVWKDLAKIEFETQGKFISLIIQRLRWKSLDHKKSAHCGKRRDDLRLAFQEEIHQPTMNNDPLEEQIYKEEKGELLLRIMELPENHRTVLKAYLKTQSNEALADELKLSATNSQKALKAALQYFFRHNK